MSKPRPPKRGYRLPQFRQGRRPWERPGYNVDTGAATPNPDPQPPAAVAGTRVRDAESSRAGTAVITLAAGVVQGVRVQEGDRTRTGTAPKTVTGSRTQNAMQARPGLPAVTLPGVVAGDRVNERDRSRAGIGAVVELSAGRGQERDGARAGAARATRTGVRVREISTDRKGTARPTVAGVRVREADQVRNGTTNTIVTTTVQGSRVQNGNIARNGTANVATAPPSSTTRTYGTDSSTYARPESSFFNYTETHATDTNNSGYQPLDQNSMIDKRVNFNQAVVFRYITMERFRFTDTIDTGWLNLMRTDFTRARAAGVKLLIRFVYSTTGGTGGPTYESDCTPARVLLHINQLAPVVNEFADIVDAVEAGFIGMWGEWYYSGTFGDVGNLSTQNATDRCAVLNRLTSLLDPKIYVLIRYPGFLHKYAGQLNNLNRYGSHNDAFLGTFNDLGTFSTFTDMDLNTTRAYLVQLTKNTGAPMSGESAEKNEPHSFGPTAISELDLFGWHSLNPNYFPEVLSSWTPAEYKTITDRLGVRLRLTESTLQNTAVANGTWTYTLKITNDGFARPHRSRPVKMVFVNGATVITRDTSIDVKTILPGSTQTFTETLTAPGAGTWTVHVWIPDVTTALQSNPAYSLRFASTTSGTSIWNGTTAYNALGHSVVVGGSNPGTPNTFTVGSTAPPASGTALNFDFRSTIYALDKWSIGSTISTYGAPQGSNINAANGQWKAALKDLGPLAWRIPLRWAGGNPGSSAGGANTTGDAVTYITNIRDIGGTPYIVIGGTNADNGFTAVEAGNMVNYFNANNGSVAGGRIERWVLGNEPENAGTASIDAYISNLPGWSAAMKASDGNILIAAPAAAYWDPATITRAAAVANIGILSYHAYDGANTDGTGFPQTGQYYSHINDLRAIRSGLKYGLEEFNWKAFYNNLADFYTWRNACFTASVIGNTLSAGGHAYQYSDSNGAIGLMNDGQGNDNQPGSILTRFPAYWGIGMWTGMNGTFRRYGSNMCPTAWITQPTENSVPTVDAYATDNGKCVLVNKSATVNSTITIGFGGATSGTYVVWSTDPNAPTAAPTQTAAGSFTNSRLTLTIPSRTVMSVELSN